MDHGTERRAGCGKGLSSVGDPACVVTGYTQPALLRRLGEWREGQVNDWRNRRDSANQGACDKMVLRAECKRVTSVTSTGSPWVDIKTVPRKPGSGGACI